MKHRPHHARPPATLLRDTKPLQALTDQAQRLAELQQLVHAQLQPAAREHCQLAAWRDGALLLIITDGHWATRLRYQQRRLLRQLQDHPAFAGLQRIVFKVQPPHTAMQRQLRSATLSAEAAENIQATAEHIDDPRLRAALERLARHGNPNA